MRGMSLGVFGRWVGGVGAASALLYLGYFAAGAGETIMMTFGWVAIVLGMVSIWRGWWTGRVGTVRRCSGCGYDLTGNLSGRCSECGAELGEGRVTVGDRRRRPVVAVMGLCLLIAGIGAVGYRGVEQLRRVVWYRYRPAGWVVDDLSSTDGAVAERAWAELARRRAEGGLSEKIEVRVAEMALAEQAKARDATGPLVEPMMMYLSDRCMAGKLTESQRERFFRQALRSELRVRSVVVAGETATVEAVSVGNEIGDPRWSNMVEFGDATIGKASFPGRVGVGMKGLKLAHRMSTWVVAAGLGEQDVTFPSTTKISLSSGDTTDDGPVVMSFDSVLHGKTVVVGAASDSNPKMVRNAALADAVRAATAVDVREPQGRSKSYRIHVSFETPPIGVAFSVAVRVGGKEFPALKDDTDVVACAKGGSSWSIVECGDRINGNAKQLDVVLRASGKMARRTIDLFEIWDGELVFEGVPIPEVEGR